jgi:large subunit ribosomal protein L19
MAKFNIQQTIHTVEKNFLKNNLPTLKIGDNVKVGVKIIEGNKERVQFYEGTIIAKKNSSINTTITVRKTLQGIGIERIFLFILQKLIQSLFYGLQKFVAQNYII